MNVLRKNQYQVPYEVTRKYCVHGRALDWGCGQGHFTLFLNESYPNLAVDTFSFEDEPNTLLESKLRRGKHVKGSSAEPSLLPFDDGEYDLIFSVGVLEHVHETGGSQIRSLLELKRILGVQGRFFCYHVPNKYSLNEFIANFLKKVGLLGSYTHSKKFSSTDIEHLLSRSGLELEEIGYYCFLPRNLTSRLPGLLVRSKSFQTCFEFVDRLFIKLIPCLCQNLYFVCKKLDK